MKHVLKMQCTSLLPKYIKRISRHVFLSAFLHKCRSLKVKLNIKCRTINVVSTVSTHTYTALWTGRNTHLLVQSSRDNNMVALVVNVDVHYLKLKMQQLTKLLSILIRVCGRSQSKQKILLHCLRAVVFKLCSAQFWGSMS